MSIEELQAAIDHWDEIKGYIWQAIPTVDHEAIFTGMEAARLVANPNIKAAAMVQQVVGPVSKWRMEQTRRIVAAALTQETPMNTNGRSFHPTRRHRMRQMRDLQDEINQWDEWKGYIWQAIPHEAFKAMVTIVNAALGVNERVEDTEPLGDE